MAEATPRSCVDCGSAVVRRRGLAICGGCSTERKRARARASYRASRTKQGAALKGATVTATCRYCEQIFEFVLRGRPRRECEACTKRLSGQARARWVAANPDKVAAIKARYREANPEKLLSEAEAARYRKYGVSADWEQRTLEAQGGRCGNPGCGATEPGGRWKRWNIDHDHRTGVARGLLCSRCNKGAGLFDDDVEKLAGMIEYLRRERAGG